MVDVNKRIKKELMHTPINSEEIAEKVLKYLKIIFFSQMDIFINQDDKRNIWKGEIIILE